MRSVVSKIDLLRATVSDIKPDIICLSETWTNIDHTNAFLHIQGYNIIARKDRTDTKCGAGGGLLIYALSDLQVFEVQSQVMYEQFNQFLQVKIASSHNKYLNINLIYRPHKLYDDREVCTNN